MDSAAYLLDAIEQQIQRSFPLAIVVRGVSARTGNALFRIHLDDELRLVVVTERFLDTDDGVGQALSDLREWGFERRLRVLRDRQLLKVSTAGLL